MNKTNFNLTTAGYESPAVNVLDVMSEGVLCQSLDYPGYGYDDENDLGII